MRRERVIGNNVQLFLAKYNMDIGSVASSLGYSIEDMTRICEGRAYLSEDEIKSIASFFEIGENELQIPKSSEEYEMAGCIHYNHHFKNQAYYEEIMDLFDLMCDVEEVL